MLPAMRRCHAVPFLLALLVAATLPGQDQPKDKPKNPPKTESAKAKDKKPEAPKDDAKTAKDPAIVAIDKFRKAKVSTKAADWRTHLPAPPLLTFSKDREYRWHLDTTAGPLVVTLLPAAAPKHVSSVIYLSRSGFYDGLEFPRVLKGFMAQGGSPTNTQSGDPGYTMDGEFLTDQKHDKPGALSAANSGPGTDGSQFFLTFVPTPHLDGKHTVHGFVTEGLETLQAIEQKGVEKDGEPLPEKVAILRSWIVVVDAPAAAPAATGK
jgi:cyclophilin family peptidyl-prolyl cis-trans isomerase